MPLGIARYKLVIAAFLCCAVLGGGGIAIYAFYNNKESKQEPTESAGETASDGPTGGDTGSPGSSGYSGGGGYSNGGGSSSGGDAYTGTTGTGGVGEATQGFKKAYPFNDEDIVAPIFGETGAGKSMLS